MESLPGTSQVALGAYQEWRRGALRKKPRPSFESDGWPYVERRSTLVPWPCRLTFKEPKENDGAI